MVDANTGAPYPVGMQFFNPSPAQVPGQTEPEVAPRVANSVVRAEHIVNTAPDAFVGIDLESRIIIWNLQAVETFGWSAEEAIGRTLFDTILPAEYREEHRRGMQRFR